jgi:uncharacterized protein YkwD
VPHLQDVLTKFEGDVIRREGKSHLKTKEGPAAVEEAIKFLEKAAPVPPLKWNEHLAKAAKEHCDDTGEKGLMQHESSKGKNVKERISEHGKFVSCYGENLSYHCETAEEVLCQLIIDDGVAERGHRLNIFNPEFKVFGCYSGPHKDYDNMTCMDFAAGFVKTGEEDPIEQHIDLFLKESVEFEMPTDVRSWK